MAAEDQSTLDFVKQNAPPRNLKEQARLAVFMALCSALHSTILHPCVHKAAARSGHTSSLSFHPYCYFRPPANLFLSISASSVLRVCFRPLTCARQKPPNSKKGRRKYAISSAHPPKTAVVLKEAHKESVVCMCVMSG